MTIYSISDGKLVEMNEVIESFTKKEIEDAIYNLQDRINMLTQEKIVWEDRLVRIDKK